MRRSGHPLFRDAVHQAGQVFSNRNRSRGSHSNTRRMTPRSIPLAVRADRHPTSAQSAMAGIPQRIESPSPLANSIRQLELRIIQLRTDKIAAVPAWDGFAVPFPFKQFVPSDHLRVAWIPDLVPRADGVLGKIGRVLVLTLRCPQDQVRGHGCAAPFLAFPHGRRRPLLNACRNLAIG